MAGLYLALNENMRMGLLIVISLFWAAAGRAQQSQTEMALLDCVSCRSQMGMIAMSSDQLRQLDQLFQRQVTKSEDVKAKTQIALPLRTKANQQEPARAAAFAAAGAPFLVNDYKLPQSAEAAKPREVYGPVDRETTASPSAESNFRLTSLNTPEDKTRPLKPGKLQLIVVPDSTQNSLIYLGLTRVTNKSEDVTALSTSDSVGQERRHRNPKVFGMKFRQKF